MTIAKSTGKSIAIMLCSMVLGFSMSAVAELGPVISQAYEVNLGNFRAPGTAGGTATFKQCSECEAQTVRVAGDARYQVNGKTVRYEDFRKAIASVSDRKQALVVVLHHLESDTIISINVSP